MFVVEWNSRTTMNRRDVVILLLYSLSLCLYPFVFRWSLYVVNDSAHRAQSFGAQ
jgi:hypothetical protein